MLPSKLHHMPMSISGYPATLTQTKQTTTLNAPSVDSLPQCRPPSLARASVCQTDPVPAVIIETSARSMVVGPPDIASIDKALRATKSSDVGRNHKRL